MDSRTHDVTKWLGMLSLGANQVVPALLYKLLDAQRLRDGETPQAVSPKSPAQQMVRRMSSLGSAARTSAGSFSKFRRAMSMRSSESPLAGGDE